MSCSRAAPQGLHVLVLQANQACLVWEFRTLEKRTATQKKFNFIMLFHIYLQNATGPDKEYPNESSCTYGIMWSKRE